MQSHTYSGPKGFQVLIDSEKIVITTKNNETNAYHFTEFAMDIRESASAKLNSHGVSGMLNDAIDYSHAQTASHCLFIVDKNGKAEPVPLHLNKTDIHKLEEIVSDRYKSIQNQKTEEFKKNNTGTWERSFTFSKYTRIKNLLSLIPVWLCCGGTTLLLTVTSPSEELLGENWMMIPFFLILLGIAVSVSLVRNYQKTIHTITLSPELLRVNSTEFKTSLINNLEVTPEQTALAIPKIQFLYNERKYIYHLWPDTKKLELNSPNANLEYQEILNCFRLIYNMRPDVLKSGF